MPANTKPIFPLTPNIAFSRMTAANTATDGTGTVATLFTAGADGARLDKVTLVPGGANVATVLRLFANNGGVTTTATNNSLLKEVRLPATVASATQENGPTIELPMDLALPAGWRLTAVLATAVAAGWHATAIGGNY